MEITDYRVQSVLRTYSKELQRTRLTRKLDSGDAKASTEKVAISEEARRRMIMERVASQAYEQAYSKGEEADSGGEPPGDAAEADLDNTAGELPQESL